MDYENFKSMMSNYAFNKRKLQEAKEELEVLFYEMTGVKGVAFDRMPSSFNPSVAESYRLDQVEKYNDRQKDIQYYQKCIAYVEQYSKRIPTDLWKLLYEKYVLGVTYQQLGERFGYSNNGMYHYLKREIEKYL